MAITQQEVERILDLALNDIEDEVLCASIREKLITPRKQSRLWEWTSPIQQYSVWLVAIVSVPETAIAFADGGFGEVGSPWGLVFIDRPNTGTSNCWYKTLEDCARDSGFFDE